HRRFRAYYAALHTGASLGELERLAGELRDQVGRTLRGTAAVQACVTLLCLPAAAGLARHLALGDAVTLRWLFVGAGLQVVAVSTTLLLYYFDFRREAFAAAVTQLVANAALTAAFGALGAGYAIACALTCAVAIQLLLERTQELLERTF